MGEEEEVGKAAASAAAAVDDVSSLWLARVRASDCAKRVVCGRRKGGGREGKARAACMLLHAFCCEGALCIRSERDFILLLLLSQLHQT
jgi:hypothetical protein